jgi:splicing factor 3B subunit 2
VPLGQEDDSRKRKKPGDVDVAIDVDSLHNGLSKDEVRRRFDEGSRQTGVGAQWASFDEDLGNMIAQESRKRLKTDEQSRQKKKEGKFKF